MPRKFWDEERIARLKKMHAEGASYLDIARYFDCTRSAIAGVCHRFGLASDAQPRRPKQAIRAEDKALPRNQPAPDPAPIVAAPAEDEAPRSRHAFPAAVDIAGPLPAEAVILATAPLVHGLPGEFMVTKFAITDEEPSVRVVAEDEESITIAMDNAQWEDANGNPIPDDAVPSRGILLDELQPYSCRWPLNDGGPFRFCGCRKLSLKGPYCAEHEKRAGGGQPKIAWNAKNKSGLSMRNAVGRI